MRHEQAPGQISLGIIASVPSPERADGWDTGNGGDGAAGKVAEIKNDAAYAVFVRILRHMAVGIKEKPVIIRHTGSCSLFRFMPVSHGGVDAQIAGMLTLR